MRKVLGIGVVLLAATGMAKADPVDGAAARKLLFNAKRIEVKLIEVDFLNERDAEILTQVAEQMPYYSAIAASPSEGLMANSVLAANSFHDVPSAGAAAIAGCNDRREAGAEACVVVAEIYPKGWEPRDLQLSGVATDAFRKEYRKGRGAKALAISPSTGKWVITKEEGAADIALADCATASEAEDCVIVVADE